MSPGRLKSARKTAWATDPSHPIAIDERVVVFSLPAGMLPRIEGCAVIKGAARGPDNYRVQFDHDSMLRERIVHRDYQRHPERFLKILQDLWRASNTPEFDDFFPDDDN